MLLFLILLKLHPRNYSFCNLSTKNIYSFKINLKSYENEIILDCSDFTLLQFSFEYLNVIYLKSIHFKRCTFVFNSNIKSFQHLFCPFVLPRTRVSITRNSNGVASYLILIYARIWCWNSPPFRWPPVVCFNVPDFKWHSGDAKRPSKNHATLKWFMLNNFSVNEADLGLTNSSRLVVTLEAAAWMSGWLVWWAGCWAGWKAGSAGMDGGPGGKGAESEFQPGLGRWNTDTLCAHAARISNSGWKLGTGGWRPETAA